MTAITAGEGAPAIPAPNRIMILAVLMVSTVMVTLDTTIANVALPHMAGSLSASTSQIAWALTSYMIATAIAMPLTGWLLNRLGRRTLLLLAVGGFVAASAMCGAAQNLPQLVFFRVLQGAFGAPLAPIAQTVVLDIFSPKERGPAMSIWGMGVMVAPILGPVLGGWLTDAISWRWVFYINLPIGILSLLGILTFIPDTPRQRDLYFSWAGFLLLSVAIAAVQVMLDRGESKGWFDSPEILIEGAIMLVALWMFLVHSFTSARPFLPFRMFADANFTAATFIGIVIGMVVFSVSALLPSMLQSIYGYSVMTTGMIVAPRGIGSMISMLFIGRIANRGDARVFISIGLAFFAASFWHMSLFTTETSASEIAWNGFFQGLGTGFIFLPMSIMGFATLAPELRADGTGIFSLLRNFASSAGISIMLALNATFTAQTRGGLIAPYGLDNVGAQEMGLPPHYRLTDPSGIAALSAEVDRQASMVGYSQVFFWMCLGVLVVIPTLFLLRRPPNATGAHDTVVVD